MYFVIEDDLGLTYGSYKNLSDAVNKKTELVNMSNNKIHFMVCNYSVDGKREKVCDV